MKLSPYSYLAEESLFRIGFGTSKFGSFNNSNRRKVQSRLNLIPELTNIGKIIIDTAPLYGGGFVEDTLGKFIPPFRDKLFVCTKYYPRDSDTSLDLINSVDASLKRLRITEIDLLQLHYPNPLANLGKILLGLVILRSSGKIKNFGISNYSAEESKEFMQLHKQFPIISNQVEINLTNNISIDQFFFPNAPKVLSYGNLMQGRLALKKTHHQLIENLANKYKLTKAGIIMLLILYRHQELFSIIKISNKLHLEEILQIFQTDFDKSELDNLMFSINEHTEVEYLDPRLITLIGDGTRAPYLTESDARMNKLGLIPSPLSLSLRIARSKLILPITVKQIGEKSYIIDSNDPFDQVKKYWAWRFAYPRDKIPVFIVD